MILAPFIKENGHIWVGQRVSGRYNLKEDMAISLLSSVISIIDPGQIIALTCMAYAIDENHMELL